MRPYISALTANCRYLLRLRPSVTQSPGICLFVPLWTQCRQIFPNRTETVCLVGFHNTISNLIGLCRWSNASDVGPQDAFFTCIAKWNNPWHDCWYAWKPLRYKPTDFIFVGIELWYPCSMEIEAKSFWGSLWAFVRMAGFDSSPSPLDSLIQGTSQDCVGNSGCSKACFRSPWDLDRVCRCAGMNSSAGILPRVGKYSSGVTTSNQK